MSEQNCKIYYCLEYYGRENEPNLYLPKASPYTPVKVGNLIYIIPRYFDVDRMSVPEYAFESRVLAEKNILSFLHYIKESFKKQVEKNEKKIDELHHINVRIEDVHLKDIADEIKEMKNE